VVQIVKCVQGDALVGEQQTRSSLKFVQILITESFGVLQCKTLLNLEILKIEFSFQSRCWPPCCPRML
jgi:hypothetical protein